jgi:acyl-coenzyme A synthetase/AMP-(fatty) acid ligase
MSLSRSPEHAAPAVHASEAFDTFVEAGATLRIGEMRAPIAAWVERGRAQRQSVQPTALRGVTDAEALALLLAALADAQRLLLCPPDTAPPASRAGSIAAGDGAIAVLSSGTLGPPKILWHRREALFGTARLAAARLGIGRGERVLIAVPVHHLYGLGAALLTALHAGAEILLLPKADLLVLNDALRTFAPQVTFATPHLLRAALQRKAQAIPGSRCLVSAGDAMPDALLARARLCFGEVRNLYGSSELGVIAIADAETPERLRPLPGVRLSLADAKEGRGRLLVAHPHPACQIETADAVVVPSSPWETGDIAEIDADGGLRVHGRADLCLNRAGRLVVLAEIEGIAASWPGVAGAVAVPWSGETAAGRGFSLVIEPEPAPTAPDIAALKREALRTLPPFARPDRYHLIPRLPRLASGKPDRRTLQKEYGHD